MRLFSQDSKVQALGRAPLFEGLSKKDLTELARLTEDMEIAAGKAGIDSVVARTVESCVRARPTSRTAKAFA